MENVGWAEVRDRTQFQTLLFQSWLGRIMDYLSGFPCRSGLLVHFTSEVCDGSLLAGGDTAQMAPRCSSIRIRIGRFSAVILFIIMSSFLYGLF